MMKNSKIKKYVILCVGYTHTGKTTFAKKIIKKHQPMTLLDSDEVAIFLRKKYPLIVNSQYNTSRYAFNDSNLKLTVFKQIYRFCLNTGLNVILSNGNLAKNMRSFVIRNAKKRGYTVIIVYFNLPMETITQRLKKTKKSTAVFIQSKTWTESFTRQKEYAELPPSKKDAIYFEIKNNRDYQIVFKKVISLL